MDGRKNNQNNYETNGRFLRIIKRLKNEMIITQEMTI